MLPTRSRLYMRIYTNCRTNCHGLSSVQTVNAPRFFYRFSESLRPLDLTKSLGSLSSVDPKKKPHKFSKEGGFNQENPQATLTHSNPRLKSLSGRLGNIFINDPRVSTCHVLGRSLIDPVFFRGWSYRHSPSIFSQDSPEKLY